MSAPLNFDLIKKVKKLEDKSIITAGINSNFEIPAAGLNTIVLDKTICKKGNAFLIQNGKIYVNSDNVNYVKISANAVINAKARKNGALNLVICKNGNEEAVAMVTIDEDIVTNQTRSISAKLVQVQKNDYFEMKIYGQVDEFVMSNSQRTFITIEEV